MANSTDRTYDDALIVLQNLYGSVTRLTLLGPLCAEYKFFDDVPALAIAFEAVYGFYREYHELPTPMILCRDLRVLGQERGLSEPHIEALVAQAQEWLGRRTVNDGPAEVILRAFREDRIRDRLRQQLETDHLQQAVGGAAEEIRTDPFCRAREENPFNDPKYYLTVTKPFPFGPPFLDLAMNGGALLGETIGLVAPSGGGKTTVGFQIVERQVYEHRHVIVISTEQKMRGDLALRVFVLATDMTRSDWAGDWDKLPARARERWEKVKEPWLKYFHFYDISKLPLTSVDELYAPVREQIELGNKPVFVIIDWWGDVRDALIASLSNQRTSEPEIRRRARSWLKEVVNKASEHQIINVILHQLKGASAGKSAAHINSTHDAQEDSNFNNRMDFAFALSRKGAGDSVSCHVDKARRYRNTVLKLRLDGERCRFHLQDDPDASGSELKDSTFDKTADDNYRPAPPPGESPAC